MLVDHFLENAIEVDVDALCDSEDVIIAGIMQHIEEAGIHSGDSSCVLPAVGIRAETLEYVRAYTRKLALALKVVGLVNLQFAIQRDAEGQDHVYVIEVNPRASRTVPYVSKATGIPLAKIAARLMTGRKLRELLPAQLASGKDLETGTHYYVKSPVFPWTKFAGVDTVLGPEMNSTGEVMGVAATFGEAFAKAQLSAGQVLPTGGTVFFSVNDHDKPAAVDLARRYVHLGFKIVATEGTANVLEARRPHRRARLQGQGGPAQRRGPDQGRPHSAHRQHAARPGHLLRREGDSPGRGARAYSHHHHHRRRAGSRRGNRRHAAAQHHGLRAAKSACRSGPGLKNQTGRQ